MFLLKKVQLVFLAILFILFKNAGNAQIIRIPFVKYCVLDCKVTGNSNQIRVVPWSGVESTLVNEQSRNLGNGNPKCRFRFKSQESTFYRTNDATSGKLTIQPNWPGRDSCFVVNAFKSTNKDLNLFYEDVPLNTGDSVIAPERDINAFNAYASLSASLDTFIGSSFPLNNTYSNILGKLCFAFNLPVNSIQAESSVTFMGANDVNQGTDRNFWDCNFVLADYPVVIVNSVQTTQSFTSVPITQKSFTNNSPVTQFFDLTESYTSTRARSVTKTREISNSLTSANSIIIDTSQSITLSVEGEVGFNAGMATGSLSFGASTDFRFSNQQSFTNSVTNSESLSNGETLTDSTTADIIFNHRFELPPGTSVTFTKSNAITRVDYIYTYALVLPYGSATLTLPLSVTQSEEKMDFN